MEMVTFSLIEMLCDTQTACKYCFNACLEEDNLVQFKECIRESVECAEICGMVLSSVSYNGELTYDLLTVCMEACARCAAICRELPHIQCLECAKACEGCIAACRDFHSNFGQQTA